MEYNNMDKFMEKLFTNEFSFSMNNDTFYVDIKGRHAKDLVNLVKGLENFEVKVDEGLIVRFADVYDEDDEDEEVKLSIKQMIETNIRMTLSSIKSYYKRNFATSDFYNFKISKFASQLIISHESNEAIITIEPDTDVMLIDYKIRKIRINNAHEEFQDNDVLKNLFDIIKIGFDFDVEVFQGVNLSNIIVSFTIHDMGQEEEKQYRCFKMDHYGESVWCVNHKHYFNNGQLLKYLNSKENISW